MQNTDAAARENITTSIAFKMDDDIDIFQFETNSF
jgi:hypothetical protein